MEDLPVFRLVKGAKIELVSNQISNRNNETLEDMLRAYLKDFTIEENNALGYISDLETFQEMVEKMKNKGFSFSIRDSDIRHKRKKSKRNEDLEMNEVDCTSDHFSFFFQLKVLPIKFFGFPFRVVRTAHYHCAYGHKYYKSRAETNKIDHNLLKDTMKVKKKRNVGSKKMGCIARMTLKSIIVYPDYKLDNETDWRTKKKLIENLRRDLAEKESLVLTIQRYYISISLQSSHNHPPMLHLPKSAKPKKVRGHKNTKQQSKQIRKIEMRNEDEWGVELASTSLQSDDKEPEVDDKQTTKILTLQDEPFFHTLVKYPGQQSTNDYQSQEYKPVNLEFQIPDYETGTSERTTTTTLHVQQYEYQSTIYDLQLLFRDKLKKLYTLSESCVNAGLLLKFTGELEQMENVLSNDVSSYTSFEQ